MTAIFDIGRVMTHGLPVLMPETLPRRCVDPCGQYLVRRPSAEPNHIRMPYGTINNYNPIYTINPSFDSYFRNVKSQTSHTVTTVMDNTMSVACNTLITCRLSGGGGNKPLFFSDLRRAAVLRAPSFE